MGVVYAGKPRILAELPRDRHAAIEASAGTGKTYTLEHLVIDLLLCTPTTLDQILVVTFTEKAATELRARLRAQITRLLEAVEPSAPPESGEAWRIDDAAREKLARALVSFDAASISTIHAFCQRMLLENAFANRRLFDQELVDGRAAFSRAFLTVLRGTLARSERYRPFLDTWLAHSKVDDLLDRLFDAHQRRGRFTPELDTKALERALAELSKIELAPAALRPALERLQLHPRTRHAVEERLAVVRRILEAYQRDKDLSAVLGALSQFDDQRRNALLDYPIEKLKEKLQEAGLIHRLVGALELLKRSAAPLESAVVQLFLPEVQARLTEEKAELGQFDFDDMLQLLDDAMTGPGGSALMETIRRRFKYALIDEFQDTDEVQWSVFRRLFVEGPGDNRLFVIGDPKQAIYAFRGADVFTYLDARARLAQAGGTVVHLVQNFRSSEALVGAVNALLDQKVTTPFFTGDIRYDHPVEHGERKLRGLARGDELLPPVHLFDLVPLDEQMSPGRARARLAKRIAEEARRLLDPREGFCLATTSGPKALAAHDIYVLTRSTKEGLEVAAEMRAARVPHAFYKQEGLFQTQEADDVRAVLAAIAEPHRRSRRLRAFQSPFFAVPLDRLFDCLDLPGPHAFNKTLFDWKEIADKKDYSQLFHQIVDDSGLTERELFLGNSERELTNYLHIFEILLEEASRTRAPLPELIHTLSAFIDGRRRPEGEEGNVQRLESEREAVQIMTHHKAKGLEAAVVFLFGGFDEVRGTAHVWHDAGERCLYLGPNPPDEVRTEALEEDQRLLYVAITRAKARLYLPWFGATGRGDELVVRNLNGTYRQLNDAIGRLMSNASYAARDACFAVEQVREEARRRRAKVSSVAVEDGPSLGDWAPHASLFQEPSPSPELASMKATRGGFTITSYSRIKTARGGYHGPPLRLEPSGAEEIAEDVDAAPVSEHELAVLPPGSASGRFLHEMLELVDLSSLQGAPGAAFWGARRDVLAIFQEGIRRYDRALEHLPHAQELAYVALTAPLILGDVRLEGGVATAERVVREMEFLYPIPESSHPRLSEVVLGPFTIERGYVKGYIDLVFELAGRVYVLDWKSDLLPSYAPAALDAHVAANYQLQAELYTLAILKLLTITTEADYEARFGGTAYAFVRGMQSDGSTGLYFSRPSWAEILESERALMATDLNAGTP